MDAQITSFPVSLLGLRFKLGVLFGVLFLGIGQVTLVADDEKLPELSKEEKIEKEFKKLLEADDEAQEEVDQWIRDNHKFAKQGAGVETAVLRARVRKRLELVRERYEKFLLFNPDHARAHLAFGSFLVDILEHEAGRVQMEKAKELDPTNPAAWNNLANYYGHNSPVSKAFDYYAKAIELNPKESTYYYNFGTTVYLFRRDATNHFKISLQQVFDKAMNLYARALELDPENFLLASDIAQTWYGIQIPVGLEGEAKRKAIVEKADKAIADWELALRLARDDIERQGVRIHFARHHLIARRFDQAKKELAQVEHTMFDKTKSAMLKQIALEISREQAAE